jgi:hypothetical protein
MEEDEQFLDIVHESNSRRLWPISFRHERDLIPFVMISNPLMTAAGSPFARLSVLELAQGLRVDRFLAMGVQWLLAADSTSSLDTRIAVNNILTEVRRHAVAWLLQLSIPVVNATYSPRWTLFLNCTLGRRACLHFQLPHTPSRFIKKFLLPRGSPTAWRFIRWESKSTTPYVDLEFELLSEPHIRQVFCFPQIELHCLAAITFAGRNLLPHPVAGCGHVEESAFWEHEDPRQNHATTCARDLLPHDGHDPNRTQPQPREVTEDTLTIDESTVYSRDIESNRGATPKISNSIIPRKAKSCGDMPPSD